MSLAAEKQQRFHFIDGFRAIASVMIVVHHSVSANVYRFFVKCGLPVVADYFSSFTGSGVDLFFVISGLVLLRPYLRKERTFNALIYFKKRFIRIYPTYFVALVFGAAVIWYINLYPTWYNEKGIHMSFTWMETIKEALLLNIDGLYYNLAWWSVQLEALFYILVPLLIFVFPHNSRLHNRGLIIIILATLAVTVALQFFFNAYMPFVYSLGKMRMNMGKIVDYPICFLMGMLLAAKDFSMRHAWAFIFSGVVLFVLHDWYLPFMHSGFGLLYAGILLVGFHNRRWQVFLSKPIFLWVGERSYSLFLVHFSVFYLIDNLAAHVTSHRGLQYALITRGLGIPLAVLASMLLFQLVERHFARGLVTEKMIWPWQTDKMKIEG